MLNITLNGWLQIGFYLGALLLLVKPLGSYMAKIYLGEKTLFSPFFGYFERIFYKISGIDEKAEMNWKQYSSALLIFTVLNFIAVFAILILQNSFPLNPQKMPDLSWHLAFNTAVSFITNTNWQSYGGETTMSYFSQMIALAVQNFLSAAVGMTVLVAMIRGFVRKNTDKIGNFWVDLVRGSLYILLPLSLLWAFLLGSQGVIQNFQPYVTANLLEQNTTQETQIIATGPVASQVAIKQLGTNGGGFFNVNSAHPFENSTPFANFLEMLAILLIPAAFCYTFGKMLKNTGQGWVLLIAMTVIFIPLMMFCMAKEQSGNPRFSVLNIDQKASELQAGGNMEGKETRFGIVNSALWASATTAASNGSVNSMHDSYTPLGGLIPLVFMQFGEVIYGGVGSGLYGMLVFVIITVFICGLMVGRTPEYLGKKIGAFEIKMAALAILAPHIASLIGTAIAVMTDAGKAGIFNPAAQGFSEILYAFTSAANNNGSAFAGLSANTPFYNVTLGIAMLLGRYLVMIPVLAIAGSMATKNITPTSNGTLPTNNALFIFILIAVILLVGVLTFVPALTLGPIAEHFNLIK